MLASKSCSMLKLCSVFYGNTFTSRHSLLSTHPHLTCSCCDINLFRLKNTKYFRILSKSSWSIYLLQLEILSLYLMQLDAWGELNIMEFSPWMGMFNVSPVTRKFSLTFTVAVAISYLLTFPGSESSRRVWAISDWGSLVSSGKLFCSFECLSYS